MPGVLTETVTAFFDVDGSSVVFILDDPVRGLLDDPTYVLGGDLAVDLPGIRSVTIRRGRERALDEITVGVATVRANNMDRIYDPEYAAGTYYGNIRPGKRVTIATNGVARFDGLIDDYDYDYPVAGDSTVTFDAADCLATLGSAEFDEWTTSAGQLVGARLTSILDRPEVAFPATRSIDTGTSTLQADLVSWGSNVLNYAQLVTKADLGSLFASKEGVLTFYGRNRSVTGVGAPIFSDVPGAGIPYSEFAIDYGTELLANRVSVDATGFTKQTVTSAASYDLFQKWWSLSLANLPLETQQQALDLANYLLNLYAFPDQRIASITVLLHGLDTDDQNAVLALDIGSVIRVAHTPNGISPAIDKYCMVEGVTESIGMGAMFHSVTLKLSNLIDAFGGQPFILDDAEWGVLDTAGHGVLAF